jgi:flagellar basal-body rod protein FlgB
MGLDSIPLFALLKSRLGYLGERQKVIATNIANSDTPGYAPHDLKPFDTEFAKAVGGSTVTMAQSAGSAGGTGLAVTQAGHMSPRRQAAKFKPVGQDDNEITLDGNGVVLEEQSIKLAEARMDYDAAIGFYQKSLGLLRMAARAPGK